MTLETWECFSCFICMFPSFFLLCFFFHELTVTLISLLHIASAGREKDQWFDIASLSNARLHSQMSNVGPHAISVLPSYVALISFPSCFSTLQWLVLVVKSKKNPRGKQPFHTIQDCSSVHPTINCFNASNMLRRWNLDPAE